MSDTDASFISHPSTEASAASLIDAPSQTQDGDLDSLPSTSADSDTASLTLSDTNSDAEREWRESLQQLELLLSLVIVPYLGKYFGRKFAYYGWKRFMEWKYPVEIVVTSPGLFKAVGAVEAAASL